jgi:hypothetical protein
MHEEGGREQHSIVNDELVFKKPTNACVENAVS